MPKKSAVLILGLASSVLLVACKQQDAATGAQAPAATATTPAEPQAAAASEDTDAAPGEIKKSDAYKMGAAMAAMTVFCGVAKPGEAEAGMAKMKVEAAANGVSPVEIDAIYSAALAQARTAAAEDPAKAEKDCASLRKMADPAELKKMQEAADKLEKLAADLEAANAH